ncbi:putative FBD-associated F-box protein At5g56700 [Argentina anserina]|uniref:putative FBD-associated F-box protein At5g56700 n=1 Tax=Argentina anserina TaxID=57926 RepID=UPI0021763989|nr:putative FBD-associated F-box protein At5g56700 [Potentilla anserina]
MVETKTKEENHVKEDHNRFNQLSDEILILVLSFISLMDAGRTCVLSKRWKELWKHLRCIHIDCEAARKSISWVDKILHLHRGLSADELKIRICSGRVYVNGVDNWIDFAVQKRVKKLELDLKGGAPYYHNIIKYIFPDKPFKFLTHLSLIYVRVMGSALRLKSLKFSECYELVMVKISAPNLVSFIYEGAGPYRCGIKILHAPSLVKVHLGEGDDCITKSFKAVRDYFLQLVTLSLRLNLCQEQIILPAFRALTQLRDLSLAVVVKSEGKSLLELTSLLIEKSPFLQSFTFEIIWNYFEPMVTRSMLDIPESPHRCLKVIRFTGLIGLGTFIDTELAMYFIQNAVVLEKLILDVGTETTDYYYKERDPVKRAKKLEARKQYALRFGAQLPPGAELIVL